MNFQSILEKKEITASVPCRVDFGGTLDISTFYLALQSSKPSTMNIALDMRTYVTLAPFTKGKVKISSRGFETAVFDRGQAPFDHPMGLMFSTAGYFDAHGLHIHIESTSPPKSALGGSSSAAVAIISGVLAAMDKPIDPTSVAWLAHYLESSVAGVPCGVQDQLAAAFGGVNQWVWTMGPNAPMFEQQPLFTNQEEIDRLNDHILVAYCGIPHVSKDINGQWVRSFIGGRTRRLFEQIAKLTQLFSTAVQTGDFCSAAQLMIRETQLRSQMTPDVLDDTGKALFKAAKEEDCGARFTGAGGGGCVWAVGKKRDVEKLKPIWHNILNPVENAKILDTNIENKGIIID